MKMSQKYDTGGVLGLFLGVFGMFSFLFKGGHFGFVSFLGMYTQNPWIPMEVFDALILLIQTNWLTSLMSQTTSSLVVKHNGNLI